MQVYTTSTAQPPPEFFSMNFEILGFRNPKTVDYPGSFGFQIKDINNAIVASTETKDEWRATLGRVQLNRKH